MVRTVMIFSEGVSGPKYQNTRQAAEVLFSTYDSHTSSPSSPFFALYL